MTGYTNPYYQMGYYNSYPTMSPTVPPYQAPYSTQGQPTVPPVQQPTAVPQAAPQAMTPPTVHAEIIQVKGLEDAERFPVNAGTSQLFQLADDTAFIIKSVLANGEADIDVYAKQPKKPAVPAFDPTVYVTRDELEERLAGLTTRHGRKPQGTEETGNGEPV